MRHEPKNLQNLQRDVTPAAARAAALLAVIVALVAILTAASTATAAAPPEVVSREVAGTALRVHYPARYARAVAEVEGKGPSTTALLARRLGMDAFPAVDVWFVHRLDDFYRWHELPGRPPEWAVGLSLSGQRTVLLRMSVVPGGEGLEVLRTFEHELAHVALDLASAGHFVPRWFHEGFALEHAGEWSAERADLVARAGATGTLIPLQENLSRSFPPHHTSASLAYAQSQHFVRWISAHHGQEVWPNTMRLVRQGVPFYEALGTVTGRSMPELEGQWRSRLAERTSAASMLVNGEYLFFGAVALFGVAWFKRRRRARRIWEHLDVGVEGWDYDPTHYPLPGVPARHRRA